MNEKLDLTMYEIFSETAGLMARIHDEAGAIRYARLLRSTYGKAYVIDPTGDHFATYFNGEFYSGEIAKLIKRKIAHRVTSGDVTLAEFFYSHHGDDYAQMEADHPEALTVSSSHSDTKTHFQQGKPVFPAAV